LERFQGILAVVDIRIWRGETGEKRLETGEHSTWVLLGL
jgi:hypothetical protein